ncbi:MAG: hypothetical protein ABWZ88_22175 [Variovorax sp.]
MTVHTSPAPNPNQVLWEKGDFTRIAATMRESGEALVKSIGIIAGQKVLDLGCGDGTTARAIARSADPDGAFPIPDASTWGGGKRPIVGG